MTLFIGNQSNFIGESLYCIDCYHKHMILLCLNQKLKIFVKIRRIYAISQIILTNNRHSCDLFQNIIVLDLIKVHLDEGEQGESTENLIDWLFFVLCFNGQQILSFFFTRFKDKDIRYYVLICFYQSDDVWLLTIINILVLEQLYHQFRVFLSTVGMMSIDK